VQTSAAEFNRASGWLHPVAGVWQTPAERPAGWVMSETARRASGRRRSPQQPRSTRLRQRPVGTAVHHGAGVLAHGFNTLSGMVAGEQQRLAARGRRPDDGLISSSWNPLSGLSASSSTSTRFGTMVAAVVERKDVATVGHLLHAAPRLAWRRSRPRTGSNNAEAARRHRLHPPARGRAPALGPA
jgi:hypothetical protein